MSSGESRTDRNIAGALDRMAAELAGETALVCRVDRRYLRWTFAGLKEECDHYAASLAAEGVGPGQRVMLMVRPSMEFVCLTFALFKLGAVVILIDPGMGYRNLLRCIGNVEPDVLVGIPRAQVFSRLFPAAFRTVRARICVGRGWGVLGRSLARIAAKHRGRVFQARSAGRDDPAAIIFTTGSTGPPKGVLYTHGIFHAQLELIRDFYRIGPGEVDQPAFPLFALFSIALGAKTVIPEMDPARPAAVDPAVFVRTILDHGVTYSFGSPAIWNVVSRYCRGQGIRLPVRKILMAGAPVPGDLVARVREIMPADGEIHTPYGATECLPVSSIGGDEILGETWDLTRQGRGVCVGRPLPGIDIRIIRAVDGPIGTWDRAEILEPGRTGEIVVRGPVVTRAYIRNDTENALAKIKDGESVWHRMGDMGYFDGQGRLWFCGRKAHRVLAAQGVMYTIPCEAVFNGHPAVFRSALVGLGEPGAQLPVIIVELKEGEVQSDRLMDDLCRLAGTSPLTEKIDCFLVHPGFPVDIRHNAKIFREKLAVWAAEQLHESGC
jgi:acyl-CoA synthetase (AMP-forming)/AMP-acid ligase II